MFINNTKVLFYGYDNEIHNEMGRMFTYSGFSGHDDLPYRFIPDNIQDQSIRCTKGFVSQFVPYDDLTDKEKFVFQMSNHIPDWLNIFQPEKKLVRIVNSDSESVFDPNDNIFYFDRLDGEYFFVKQEFFPNKIQEYKLLVDGRVWFVTYEYYELYKELLLAAGLLYDTQIS